MPELPEVENVRRSLAPHLVGQVITHATLFRADVCTTADGRPASAAALLAHGRIASIERHGKQLAVIATDGRALGIHLGMTGQVLVRSSPPEPDEKHVHALWKTTTKIIVFKDPRRFGGLWTFPSRETLRTERWAALGPDALDADPQQWASALRLGHRPIKALLLDQAVVAGIGNIYADEALHLAGVHPETFSSRLTVARAASLAAAVRQILSEAVEAGGSTLRDYRDANGTSGRQQEKHRVYGRSGQRCLSCDLPLKTGVCAQRTTVWCPGCQRRS